MFARPTPIALLATVPLSLLLPAKGELPPPQFSVNPHVKAAAHAQFGELDAGVRAARVTLDLGALWTLAPQWRLGLETGIEHSHYRLFNFQNVLPGATEPLKDAFQMKLAPTFTYLVNDQWALVGGATFAAAGDPDADFADALTVGGVFGARRQFNERFALTFGAIGGTRLEDTVRGFPVIGIEWQLAQRWRLATQGAAGQLSYAVADPLQVFLRLAFELREYRLADDASIPGGVLRDQFFPLSVGLDWRPSPATKVVLQAGMDFSRSVRIRDGQRATLLELDANGAPFLSLGVNLGFGGSRRPAAEPEAARAFELAKAADSAGPGGSTLQVWEENDSMTGTDHSYTQGLQLAYLAPEHAAGEMPGWLAWFGEGLPALGFEPERARFTFATGQLMFTPANIRTPAFQPGDRPYAAWIYGAPALQRRGATAGGTAVLEELRLGLGWVGPGALGGEAQNFIHRTFEIGLANGWAYQLRNEPTAALTYARAWRMTLAGEREGGALDFIPHGALTGGTPRTQASAGALVRIGVNLPDDFGRPTIQSGLPLNGAAKQAMGIHVFAAIEGRAVARDTFLDGNLWHASHRVEARPLGLETQVGLVVTTGRVDLGFTYARQSPETALLERKNHDYGSLWLNWRI